MYATVTNIVAYLPFLLVTGSAGEFLHSLPIVMTVSLVASRLVSMTFLPLLGYYLLRPEKKVEKTLEERRNSGFFGLYARAAKYSIEHRWKFFVGSLAFLALGVFIFSRLNSAFFPEDVQYWSYTMYGSLTTPPWKPRTRPPARWSKLSANRRSGLLKSTRGMDINGDVLRYVTSFIGGGGPRFYWLRASLGKTATIQLRAGID